MHKRDWIELTILIFLTIAGFYLGWLAFRHNSFRFGLVTTANAEIVDNRVAVQEYAIRDLREQFIDFRKEVRESLREYDGEHKALLRWTLAAIVGVCLQLIAKVWDMGRKR